MNCVGLDGCRAGWVGLRLRYERGTLREWEWRLFPDFERVLNIWGEAEALAVDMPIGLLSSERAEPRPCDRLARQRLGRRASCVFIPPTRPMLTVGNYASLRSLGLSIQAYHLIPRIHELDCLITPELQRRVWEAHPELGFMALIGTALLSPKRTPEGHQARLSALQTAFGAWGCAIWEGALALRTQVGKQALGLDDLTDAWVLAWSARRHLSGQSETLIGDPAYDERGLLMAIRF